MKGHLCTYTVSNNKLLLSNLEINNNRKIKINEIGPMRKKYIHLALKHGLKNVLYNYLLEGFDYKYKNIGLNIVYTGYVLIGRGHLWEYEEIFDYDECLISTYLFEEVLKLEFINGDLVQVENISEEIDLKRKKLISKY